MDASIDFVRRIIPATESYFSVPTGATVPLNFFGISIEGPIETNLSGTGKPIIWPSWSPIVFRCLDNFGPVPPGFTYLQGITQWSKVETADGVYDWSLFDLVWPRFIAEGVTDVLFGLQDTPQWAVIGNNYNFSCSITAASPGVVTATGNNYANGWRVFFNGGTVPTGLTLGTIYFVVNLSGNTFNVSATSGGAPINTSGSAGSSTVVAMDTPPASMSKLTDWVTSYLTRATLNGLSIKYVENLNEPNNGPGFWVGTTAELVTMQQFLYNAAKAYDPSIQVLTFPVNNLAATRTAYMNSFLSAGGGAYCDIIGYHGYASDPPTFSPVQYASDLANWKSMLVAQGQGQKPLWNTENSTLTGVNANNVTWLSRSTFIDLAANVARKFYYPYDQAPDRLWDDPSISPPIGANNIAGTAYQQVINWLANASVINPYNVSGVIATCDITRSGYQARVAWTTDASTPSYPVPSFATQYRDLTGATTTGLGATVTIGGNPIIFESGLPSYQAPAVSIDGSTYLNFASLTNTDNAFISFSIWVRRLLLTAGTVPTFFVVAPGGAYDTAFQWKTAYAPYNFRIWYSDTSNGNRTTSGWASIGNMWTHILFSGDISKSTNYNKLYINDVSTPFGTSTNQQPATNILVNGKQVTLFGDTFNDNVFGDVADFWIGTGQSLLDSNGDIPLATRRKFIDQYGKPVFLGATGQLPTGTTPRIFLSGTSSTFATNLGSGGACSVVGGTITNALNSPSWY